MVAARSNQVWLEELVKLGPTYSPVFDTVTRAVNVEVRLDKGAE